MGIDSADCVHTFAATSSLPLFMYKVDAVLVAQTTHHTRRQGSRVPSALEQLAGTHCDPSLRLMVIACRLRVLHQGEGSILMTSAVLLGVLSFFLFYFTLLFVIFTVGLIPLPHQRGYTVARRLNNRDMAIRESSRSCHRKVVIQGSI